MCLYDDVLQVIEKDASLVYEELGCGVIHMPVIGSYGDFDCI